MKNLSIQLKVTILIIGALALASFITSATTIGLMIVKTDERVENFRETMTQNKINSLKANISIAKNAIASFMKTQKNKT